MVGFVDCITCYDEIVVGFDLDQFYASFEAIFEEGLLTLEG